MNLDRLRSEALEINRALGNSGLVVLTWGNVSAADRTNDLCAIKPSGLRYEDLSVEDIVVVKISSGEVVKGDRNPSSDTPTHLFLYRSFPDVGGIAHTHSAYATAWAQAGRAIPCLGTTHADSFHGSIPITRNLSAEEIAGDYEANSGKVIVEHFAEAGLTPAHSPSVLLPHHGPFTWGKDAAEAFENSIILEAVARMAYLTRIIAPDGSSAPADLADRHFARKHGSAAYYGQRE